MRQRPRPREAQVVAPFAPRCKRRKNAQSQSQAQILATRQTSRVRSRPRRHREGRIHRRPRSESQEQRVLVSCHPSDLWKTTRPQDTEAGNRREDRVNRRRDPVSSACSPIHVRRCVGSAVVVESVQVEVISKSPSDCCRKEQTDTEARPCKPAAITKGRPRKGSEHDRKEDRPTKVRNASVSVWHLSVAPPIKADNVEISRAGFASAEVRVGWSSPAWSPAENHVDASQDQFSLCTRELADALGEQRLVQRNYL